MNILVNLPPGFFAHPSLRASFDRLDTLGEVRRASHNTPEEIAEDLAWADAVIMWSWPIFDAALLAKAPNLRYVGHIDVSQRGAVAELAVGLQVSVSRHGFSPAVSEMALALILSALRDVSGYHARMRAATEAWVADFPGDIPVTERELTGARVGIIGLGRVGSRLAELLAPFHCELRVYDPYVPEELITKFNAQRKALNDLMAESEVVVICAASNSGTAHLIGAEQIALLRPGAVLVNVARAALVDTVALISRLKRGDITAALDVFDTEPLAPDSELRQLSNALLTPHRAGGLITSVQRNIGWLIDDLEAVIAGAPRRHAVTEQMIPMLDA